MIYVFTAAKREKKYRKETFYSDSMTFNFFTHPFFFSLLFPLLKLRWVIIQHETENEQKTEIHVRLAHSLFVSFLIFIFIVCTLFCYIQRALFLLASFSARFFK
jgi:hypothetical protein